MDNKPQGNGTSSLLDRLSKSGASASNLAKAAATGKPVEQVIQHARMVETGAALPKKPIQTTDTVITGKAKEKSNSAVKPKKTSDKQVLFHCPHRPNMGSPLPSRGEMVRFNNGWLLTDRTDVIDFVRANAKAWGITEEK